MPMVEVSNGGTPTEGIYCNKIYTSSGYYDYDFGVLGWSTSTQLIFKGSQSFNAIISNITSLTLDGVAITVPSYHSYTFGTGLMDGNIHILEFTVVNGQEPSFTGNTTSSKFVDTLIFNK